MPWVRIDDGFARHPKVVAAGPLAMAMQVAGLCYCNQELTDGFVPRSVARTLIDWEIVRDDGRIYRVSHSCGMVGDDVSCQWVIDIMVEAGMWHEVNGGYLIHDYGDYQPSKEQVSAERGKNAERQARWRESHSGNANSNAVTNAVTNAPVTGAPYPYPVPNTKKREGERPNGLLGESEKKPYPSDFEQFWEQYPSGHGVKKTTAAQWQKLKPDERLDAAAGLARWKSCERWREGYIKPAELWLRDRWWENDPPPPKPVPIRGKGSGDQSAQMDQWANELKHEMGQV